MPSYARCASVPVYHDGSSLYLWHVQSLRPGGATASGYPQFSASSRVWQRRGHYCETLGVDTGTWERPRADTLPCYYCESMFVWVWLNWPQSLHSVDWMSLLKFKWFLDPDLRQSRWQQSAPNCPTQSTWRGFIKWKVETILCLVRYLRELGGDGGKGGGEGWWLGNQYFVLVYYGQSILIFSQYYILPILHLSIPLVTNQFILK